MPPSEETHFGESQCPESFGTEKEIYGTSTSAPSCCSRCCVRWCSTCKDQQRDRPNTCRSETTETATWATYHYCESPNHRFKVRWHKHKADDCSVRKRWLQTEETKSKSKPDNQANLATDDNDDATTADEQNKEILKLQKQFYDFLTNGSLSGIQKTFGTTQSSDVQEVLDLGGNIDDWDKCLQVGARPEGMKVSGADVLVVSDTEAYSTIIEFPKVGTKDGLTTASLLAVQKWSRKEGEDDASWKLELHQTIPWGNDSRAGATLLCDYRGCTALTSEPKQKWNFRGMID